MRLSIEERREAVLELSRAGMSQREIGGVLGVDHRTIGNDLRTGEIPRSQLNSGKTPENRLGKIPHRGLGDGTRHLMQVGG